MKRGFWMRTWFMLLLLAISLVSLSAQVRTDLQINSGWRFTRENPGDARNPGFNISSWEKVTLPHTWNAKDGQDGGNDYYRGTGWYRTTLNLSHVHKDKRLFLKFDGAASATEVYVNGKLAGKHKGNFGAFCFEITDFVEVNGKNILAVRVNNAKDSTISPLRGDFTVFGGLYRDVHLLVLNQLSISPLDDGSSGVYIKQERVTGEIADLQITTKVLNGTNSPKSPLVRVTLLDQKGKIVQTGTAQGEVAEKSEGEVIQKLSVVRPHLWNGRLDPYLYTIRVELMDRTRLSDRIVESTGLRYFKVDPEKGFFLNGEPYRVYGVCRHQDRENMGWAITAREHEEDFRMIEEIGANAVRLAHYQHAQEFYNLCDRGGMIVWAELALVDEIHPSPEFKAICRQQLRELIKQNYNHPSIVFWSLENELVPDGNPDLYSTFVKDLNSLAKQLDPTRLTTVASRSKYDGNDGINSATDVVAYNVYKGWYEGKPENFAGYADKLHEKFPNRAMAISEYGAGASIHQHEYPPQKPAPRGLWHPEEWQSLVHEVTWKAISERPYLWGSFLWNMFDFASDGRAEGEHMGQNDKGLVSYDRKTRKDAFYFYKAHWNPEPMVHISSKRYSPRPAGPTEIKVYSNCQSVELFVDGKSVGAKESKGKVFTWDAVHLPEGKIRIAAVGVAEGKRLKDEATIVATTPGSVK